jgi:hypothetical protein
MIIRKIPRYAILSPFIRRCFKGKIVGEVWFYQLSDMRVVLKGRVEGFGKERTYAIHIHEFGDCCSFFWETREEITIRETSQI